MHKKRNDYFKGFDFYQMLKKLLYIGLLLAPVLVNSQSCPSLLSPIAGSTNVPVEATIVWDEVPGVPGYRISLGTTSGGDDIVSNQLVGSATFFSPPFGLPENTQIFVTITLFFFDNQGDIVCPSIPFTTESITAVPECANLSSPINGATNVNASTNISWAYAPRASSYEIDLGTSAGNNDLGTFNNSGNQLFVNPPANLPTNTQVFVEIRSFNAIGQSIGCITQSFTTADIVLNLGCTTLISPRNGDSNVALTPVLEWVPVSGASGYRVSIGTTPDDNNILQDGLFTNNRTLVIEFEPNRTLFVTIIPFNDLGEAINCGQETFSTAIGCGPFLDRVSGEFITLFPELDFPDTISLCDNSPGITLSTSTLAETYRWALITSRGTEIELLSETSEAQITEGGLYRLDVSNFADPNGNNIPCTTSQEFTVEVIPGPNINAIDVERDGDNLRLTVNVSGNSQYDFALNDINGPYQDSNVFTNVPLGDNTVYVRDKNENGCILAQDVEQDLISEGFPKFFTPNGDGFNDFWQFIPPPNAEDFEILSISIFDRFGRLLSQIGGDSIGWNGLFNGRPLPSSDYWYRAVGIDNREFKGHFALRR
ncbi:hypothetical protein DKG77_08330 [Flagellimonas aquimarina]|uniref:Gliding motility-associated C-terminal domain-containing protein n=2 Tax=Flagellimonas aquimarina TaxID=2201895 RepID=A0A316KZM1_9FLAO|nr:hypothetical protein DKG77_08330 [Allomuricauda koreensis]